MKGLMTSIRELVAADRGQPRPEEIHGVRRIAGQV
jgi:hypothetical protein